MVLLASSRDRRYAPRIQGGIALSYRRAGAVDWFQPEPWMDFSLTGLRFQDVDRLKAGERLELRMRIPADDREHEATAEVVRIDPLSVHEAVTVDLSDGPLPEPATCEVAVSFATISPEATEALAAFMERIQNAALVHRRSLALDLLGR
jgi:hypothetical protein